MSPASPNDAVPYVGTELDVFRGAHNWKAYWMEQVRPFLGGRVLEVGAGLGENTVLLRQSRTHWSCLEPDPHLFRRLSARLGEDARGRGCEAVAGTIAGLPEEPTFDTVLYIDVLEHIADDRGEVERAAARLLPGGHLVVLSPAHQFLFSAFDAAIGHERRYDRASLTALATDDLELVSARYLDSAGILLSLANRLLLRRPIPTPRNIATWDRLVVPVSAQLDRLLGYRVGKSVLVVWRKRG